MQLLSEVEKNYRRLKFFIDKSQVDSNSTQVQEINRTGKRNR